MTLSSQPIQAQSALSIQLPGSVGHITQREHGMSKTDYYLGDIMVISHLSDNQPRTHNTRRQTVPLEDISHNNLHLGDLPTPDHMRLLQDPHPSPPGDINSLQVLLPCLLLGNNHMASSQVQEDRCNPVTFNIRNATERRRHCLYDFALNFRIFSNAGVVILQVGINYIGQAEALQGCIEDVRRMKGFLLGSLVSPSSPPSDAIHCEQGVVTTRKIW